jgi:hypothetical protein
MSPNAILEFFLCLLRDPEAATAYRADPAHALHMAGLGALSPQDIAAVTPIVAESALVTGDSPADIWSGVDISRAFGYPADT